MRDDERVNIAVKVFAITKTILLEFVFVFASIVFVFAIAFACILARTSSDACVSTSLHFFLDIELKASYKGDTSAYCCTSARD